jgi:hypothetical protein
MSDSLERQIAERLSPLISEHLAQAQARLQPRIVREPDPTLMDAARGVADALGRLEQARYSRGEIHARMALEKQARALRKALGRRGK